MLIFKDLVITDKEMSESSVEVSVFQIKYNEFVEDLLGALPEYISYINIAKALSEEERIVRFKKEVNITGNESGKIFTKNPGTVLPGVILTDLVWSSLSENTQKAIWEHLRILSICLFMESGFTNGKDDEVKPEWLDDAMNEMKDKLKNVDFEGMLKKFMTFFKPTEGDNTNTDDNTGVSGEPSKGASSFFNKMPKLPEKFLKGQLAKLAEELVKDIKPEDLGMSPELIEECEKSPSRAFDILLNVFSNNPDVIQHTIQKIGKRLQQKIISGAIRPQEIAREAEELMKEFVGNSSFVEMMSNLKSAFGFEDMDLARSAGREGSARLSLARDRLRKKLEKRKQGGK
jgi:hypothetical protein